MTDRRTFLAASGAALLLVGCAPGGPGMLTVRAQGGAGMNPGPDGADRPLTLTLVQLTSPAAFQSADFFSLQEPQAALGDTLLQADQIVLAPGGSASQTIGLEDGVEVIGVVAGFRDPAGRTFRATTAAPASGDAGIVVSVGAGGISIQPA